MSEWFKIDGINMQWLSTSPSNRKSYCDGCDRGVTKDERRLRVDDGMGAQRPRGHGKLHTYLCKECALVRIGAHSE